MADERKFFQVISIMDFWHMKLPDHLEKGYEDYGDFKNAARRLVERWHGRIGESLEQRYDLHRLCFWDTPGCCPDKEWLPDYLLRPVPMPDYVREMERGPSPSEALEAELAEAFGFD